MEHVNLQESQPSVEGKEASAERLRSRHTQWMQKFKDSIRPRLSRAGLEMMARDLAVEFASAMDTGSPMTHVQPSNVWEFLVRQTPTVIGWIDKWRRAKQQEALVVSLPETN